MNDFLQWTVSTLAGVAIGIGLAKVSFRPFGGVKVTGQRPPVRNPAPGITCHHRFAFERMQRHLYHGRPVWRALYVCQCGAMIERKAHRFTLDNEVSPYKLKGKP